MINDKPKPPISPCCASCLGDYSDSEVCPRCGGKEKKEKEKNDE
jgi:rRNA maturation endonuclease Nob1